MTHKNNQDHHIQPCPEGKIERFIEPCLLLLLAEQPSHGYELMDHLHEFEFDPRCMDPGQIYRALRRMEKERFVKSKWETGDSGPARRRYAVTEEGLDFLDSWMNILGKRVRIIDKLLKRYKDNIQR